ncbi:hypothetical protein [Streptomyces sp. WMMC905]|uniref:hypothetical protein n=1 Tax=Streptomyces sp. WMMC905 TaxID=3404123 RepID=UPI003B962904
MHRTWTTTPLVITALATLASCVTVQAPTATPSTPGTHPAASPPHRQDAADPRLVRAPAHEALELIAPSPGTRVPGTASPSASAPVGQGRTPPEATPTAPPTGIPTDPAGARSSPPRVPGHGQVPLPLLAPPEDRDWGALGAGEADLCALGGRYGRWPADSAQARVCERAYGR